MKKYTIIAFILVTMGVSCKSPDNLPKYESEESKTDRVAPNKKSGELETQ